MRRRAIVILATTLVASCALDDRASNSGTTGITEVDAVETILESQIRRLGVPEQGAILIAVIDDEGGVTHVSSAADSDQLLSPSDPIRIASITKAFTAALILDLVEEGLIDLDEPAKRYTSRLDIDPDVTIRHLLSHRSGLPDYQLNVPLLGTPDLERREWTPEELFDGIPQSGLDFAPGSRFAYNNTNYLVLGVIAEEVTDLSYHVALRERILDPLDLESTYVAHFETGVRPVEAFTGRGLAPGQLMSTNEFGHTSIETATWAAGILVSTVEDVAKFFRALGSGKLLSEETVDAMLDATLIAPGEDGPTDRYSYGLGVEVFETHVTVFGIRGDYAGYTTLVMYSPDDRETWMFVSTNDLFRYNLIEDDAAAHIAD